MADDGIHENADPSGRDRHAHDDGANERATRVAFDARNRIKTHEEVCEERFTHIKGQLASGEKRMDRIERVMIRIFGATLVQLLAVIGGLIAVVWGFSD